jgi:CubicO group peptidase (beta-lactamase class C family)
LTVLVERITNERFVKFIEREIWQKIGAESDALFQNGAYGRAATPLGMNSTLRDFARYGLAFTPSGEILKTLLFRINILIRSIGISILN